MNNLQSPLLRAKALGAGFVELFVGSPEEEALSVAAVLLELERAKVVGSAISGADLGIAASAVVRIATDADNTSVLVAQPSGSVSPGIKVTELIESLGQALQTEVDETDGSFYWDFASKGDSPDAIQSLTICPATSPAVPLSLLLGQLGGYYCVVDERALVVPPRSQRIECYLENLPGDNVPIITFVRAGARRSVYFGGAAELDYSIALHSIPSGQSFPSVPAGTTADQIASALAFRTGMDIHEDSEWLQENNHGKAQEQTSAVELRVIEGAQTLFGAPQPEFLHAAANLAQLPATILRAVASFEQLGIPGLGSEVTAANQQALRVGDLPLTPVPELEHSEGSFVAKAVDLMFAKDGGQRVGWWNTIQMSPAWQVLKIIGGAALGLVLAYVALTGGVEENKAIDVGWRIFLGIIAAFFLWEAYDNRRGIRSRDRARALVEQVISDGAYVPATSSNFGSTQVTSRDYGSMLPPSSLPASSRTGTDASAPRPPQPKSTRKGPDDTPPPGMIKL